MQPLLDPQTPLPLGDTVTDFWQWAMSSMAENAVRGLFAEYIVMRALQEAATARIEWDAADIRYRDQLVEVKSSADHQVWEQAEPSTPRFDIAKKQWWNAETNEWSAIPERPAHVYVFCHYKGAATAEAVLRLDDWHFSVVPTSRIEAELGDQKSLGLSTLKTLASPIAWSDIREAIDAAVDQTKAP